MRQSLAYPWPPDPGFALVRSGRVAGLTWGDSAVVVVRAGVGWDEMAVAYVLGVAMDAARQHSAASPTGATMHFVSTREKAEQVLKGLPEEQVPVALEALEAVERDARVLRVLRERNPEKSERELMESLATIKRGREATRRIGEAFADVDPEEIEREAVKAVREVRQVA